MHMTRICEANKQSKAHHRIASYGRIVCYGKRNRCNGKHAILAKPLLLSNCFFYFSWHPTTSYTNEQTHIFTYIRFAYTEFPARLIYGSMASKLLFYLVGRKEFEQLNKKSEQHHCVHRVDKLVIVAEVMLPCAFRT